MLSRLLSWAKRLKLDIVALWIASRSPLTPLAAKLVAGAVAAYALSPVDLIPDFIPILGHLDDVVILPLGIALAARMIPDCLMVEYRAQAALIGRPGSRIVAVLIVGVWLLGAIYVAAWFWRKFIFLIV